MVLCEHVFYEKYGQNNSLYLLLLKVLLLNFV